MIKVCKCGKEYKAKEADLKRGWAKSCSKSCAAKRSNKIIGKFKKINKHIEESNDSWSPYGFGYEDGE